MAPDLGLWPVTDAVVPRGLRAGAGRTGALRGQRQGGPSSPEVGHWISTCIKTNRPALSRLP